MPEDEKLFTDAEVTYATGLHVENIRKLINWGAVSPAKGGKGRGNVRLWDELRCSYIARIAAMYNNGFSLRMAHTISIMEKSFNATFNITNENKYDNISLMIINGDTIYIKCVDTTKSNHEENIILLGKLNSSRTTLLYFSDLLAYVNEEVNEDVKSNNNIMRVSPASIASEFYEDTDFIIRAKLGIINISIWSKLEINLTKYEAMVETKLRENSKLA
ncbi:MAG: hypothetical protein WCK65_13705 [Rhodospirillaceae bacterium]